MYICLVFIYIVTDSQNQRNVSQEFQEPLHNSITIFEVLHLALEQQKEWFLSW